MPPTDPETTHWFATQLQPHEPLLRAWLRGQFSRQSTDIEDVIQETYVRVLRQRTRSEVRSPKAFLFAVARNIVLSQIRHQTVVPMLDLDQNEASGVPDEGADVPHAVAR